MDTTLSELLASADRGDPEAAQALFAALYSELHRLASQQLARHGRGSTVSPTTLLHEAYLGMSSRDAAIFPDRARFMGYAAKVMRGLIIDCVRRGHARKRGGAFEITTLVTDVAAPPSEVKDLECMRDALERLTNVAPMLAQVVDLKFFCGFSLDEIASLRGVSKRTVQRDWEKARIYLHDVLVDAPMSSSAARCRSLE